MEVKCICMGVWTKSALCYSYDFLRSPMHVCKSRDIYQLSFCVSFHECWKHKKGWQYSSGKWLSVKCISQDFECLSLGPSTHCESTVSIIPMLGYAVRSWELTRGHPVSEKPCLKRRQKEMEEDTHQPRPPPSKLMTVFWIPMAHELTYFLGLWKDITEGVWNRSNKSLATVLGQRMLSSQWWREISRVGLPIIKTEPRYGWKGRKDLKFSLKLLILTKWKRTNFVCKGLSSKERFILC